MAKASKCSTPATSGLIQWMRFDEARRHVEDSVVPTHQPRENILRQRGAEDSDSGVLSGEILAITLDRDSNAQFEPTLLRPEDDFFLQVEIDGQGRLQWSACGAPKAVAFWPIR